MPLTKIQSLGITDGTIVNADINARAAIAGTKLSGAGKVLQVVNATTSTEVSTSSSSFTDTGLNVSITPTSASNKILVLVNQTGLRKSNAGTFLRLKLQRVTTDIKVIEVDAGYTGNSDFNSIGGTGISYLDSPNTTSSTNYKTVFNNQAATGLTYVNISDSTSSITLIEIAG